MKRILALDGGGIRGVFSLQVLRRIESIFRQEHGRDDLVLADVFDLFAGTSTGAIIATCLCWGMPVAEIERLYLERGRQMFTPEPWYLRWRSKYRAESLAAFFRDFFTESDGSPAELGTQRLRKLLLVVMRNASTGSPWPLTNNPRAIFNDPSLPDCNLKIPLWQLLRASTAAPTFFPPELIDMAGCGHLFVDGGITPFNNPALLAVLMATLPQYRIEWPAGRDRLHVISIGTGLVRVRLSAKLREQVNLVDHIRYVAPALVSSFSLEQDMLCRILGDCLHGHPLDSEIGALEAPTLLSPAEQKFTYVRYNEPVRSSAAAPHSLPKLDDLRLMPELISLGRAYAERTVRPEHLHPRSAWLAERGQ